ncbi:hypothetical protein GOM49_14320 [Clostridium bovifaecis]|uniref:Uncharacterized protein n=1 Tax=Clostridium bovifaecis TaxID=2184719 RepID=A0A6I6EV13_9CLOT|nr:hypothetical protein GOM49_14320 [Clostridium bovifaecis]
MGEKCKMYYEDIASKKKNALYMLLGAVYSILILAMLIKPVQGVNFYLGEIIGVLIIVGIYFILPITLINFIQAVKVLDKEISKGFKLIEEITLLIIIVSLVIMAFLLCIIIF